MHGITEGQIQPMRTHISKLFKKNGEVTVYTASEKLNLALGMSVLAGISGAVYAHVGPSIFIGSAGLMALHLSSSKFYNSFAKINKAELWRRKIFNMFAGIRLENFKSKHLGVRRARWLQASVEACIQNLGQPLEISVEEWKLPKEKAFSPRKSQQLYPNALARNQSGRLSVVFWGHALEVFPPAEIKVAIGHEVGHLAARHAFLRRGVCWLKGTTILAAASGTVMSAASGVLPFAGAAGATLAVWGALIALQMRVSRQNEYQADRLSIALGNSPLEAILNRRRSYLIYRRWSQQKEACSKYGRSLSRFCAGIEYLFDGSHPTDIERIRRLAAIARAKGIADIEIRNATSGPLPPVHISAAEHCRRMRLS
jgi:Zn-dependent protease with chaperone function